MKLLLDENLSPNPVRVLSRAFPGTQHVEDLGLRGRSDLEVWDLAARSGFVIVSKDNDFRQFSFLHGHPPTVIWLSVDDAGTAGIVALPARERVRILAFQADDFESLLVLERPREASDG